MKGNNELRKHQAADTIKWIVAFVLIVAMIGAIICLALQVGGVVDFFNKDNAPAAEQTEAFGQADDLQFDIHNSSSSTSSPIGGIRGVTFALATTAAEVTTDSRQLELTVKCENSQVDTSATWTIEWVTNPGDNVDINDYLTISVNDGVRSANQTVYTCTVTAKKAFLGGVALIKAVTKVGGFEATCSVAYEGVPLKFGYSYGGNLVESMGYMSLDAGATYNIDLVMDNRLHSVGSKFGDYEIVKIQGCGRFNAKVAFAANGAIKNEVSTTVDLATMEWYGYKTSNYNERDFDNPLYLDQNKFISATVEGAVLKVTVKKTVESLSYDGTVRNGSVIKYDSPWRDGRADADDVLYFEIFMKEKVSNVTSSIRIRITSTVSGAQFSTDSITF